MSRDSNDGLSEGFAPAFPIRDLNDHPGPWGLTLRDYFAAKAMQGMLSSQIQRELGARISYDETARVAYVFADAMLKERQG